jgi:diguanylate cyclase (GGDEF)-like protein/PAS domain S-box-containing protein
VGRLTPLIRISLGLVVLTCSILLTADMIGLLPRPENLLFEKRIQFCERLAAQAAGGTGKEDLAALRRILELAAKRNDDLVSAGLRQPSGRLVLASSGHRDQWKPTSESGSSPTHVRIPLFNAGQPWATLEVRFADSAPQGFLAALWERPIVPILAFVSAVGSIGYLVYMRRTLRHLDPSAVVPARVQMALDVMAEGVVLIDAEEQIVLANSAFVETLSSSRTALMGSSLRNIDWQHRNAPGVDLPLPWSDVLSESKQSMGSELMLRLGGQERVFVVNASPVLDGWDKAKGAIVTFDDVTELARRTEELERSNTELQKSREEIQLQNQELEELAKRDSLTGVSNRRAFLEVFEERFTAAQSGKIELSCVMVDIDFFKKVNDDHGHAMGDEVIRRLASALRSEAASVDMVCRWGGEEFILIFDAGIEEAVVISERLRKSIDSPGFCRVSATASFGVAAVEPSVDGVQDLINRSDEALYASKDNGRNQVTRWDEMDHSQVSSSEALT